MVKRSDDTRVRFALMQMVERCPSGTLGYEVDGVYEPVSDPVGTFADAAAARGVGVELPGRDTLRT